MTTAREITLSGRRGLLAGLRAGDPSGPKVLAVHGWLDNAASFLPLLPHLAAFDVVALDLPGHGGSDHVARGDDYHYVDWLHDLLDALDALAWPSATLLGHSLGATLCSTLAAVAPERVERLWLVEGLGPLSADPVEAAARLKAAIIGRRHALSRGEREVRVIPDVGAAVRARLSATVMRPEDAALIVARNLREVPEGFVWRSDPRLRLPSAIRLPEAAVCSILAAIEAPTALVLADPVPVFFPQHLQEARVACLRDCRVSRLHGGHHLHMEFPAEVAALLGATESAFSR